MTARRRIGPYVVESAIRAGAGREVLRCVGPDGPVVVKVQHGADDGAHRRFRQEARVLAQMQDPGVVPLLRAELDAETPWFAMPLRSGAAWSEWVERLHESGERLRAGGMRRVLEIGRRLCRVLAYIHARGVVHRDLSPANVIVERDDRVVVIDFGACQEFPAAISRSPLVAAGVVVGTETTMAPEQWRGAPVDARADLHALGALLAMALTGRPPFSSRRESQDPERRAEALQGLLPRIPAEIAELVHSLLEFSPADRPGYASDVERRLSRFLGRPSEAPVEPPRVYPPRLRGRGAGARAAFAFESWS